MALEGEAGASAGPERPRVCGHLQAMLDDPLSAGAKVVFAGQAWSNNYCSQHQDGGMGLYPG